LPDLTKMPSIALRDLRKNSFSFLEVISRGAASNWFDSEFVQSYGDTVPGGEESQQQSDAELVERVQKGETRRFAELLSRYQDRVFSLALRFVRGEKDAEDISQEAFLRAYRGLEEFRRDSKFSTWLYRITWNLCADWLRHNRKPGRTAVAIDDASDLADGRVDLEQGLLAEEEKEKVRAALDGLDEKYRTVLVLHYYQRMPNDQVAAVLEVPVKTVETRLYRARKLLRESLQRAGLGGVV
jgi:RNA polymerase sigma-70 factor, ECF subfamily